MAAERARVETEGWGARLLACQDADGQWAGGAFAPADFDDANVAGGGPALDRHLLRAVAASRVRPRSRTRQRARRTVALVGANARWEEGGQPFWEGEVEECINGRTVADGAYFGVDVGPIVDAAARRAAGRTAAGTASGPTARCGARSTRRSTCVEGLLEYERATGGTPAVARGAAVRRGIPAGARGSSAGSRPASRPIRDFLPLWHPNRWRHDILRGLDHFRAAGLSDGARPIRASARRSPSSAGAGWPTAAGRSTGRRAGGSGSRWTRASASRRAGSRCARCGCCAGGNAGTATG